jgi:hypothetical protein
MNFATTTETVETLIHHIAQKIPTLYLRFGDGDFNLMDGRGDMLAAPSAAIQQEYALSFKLLNETHMIGINYHCKENNTLEHGMRGGVHQCPIHIVNQNIQQLKQRLPCISKLYSPVALHHVLILRPDLYAKFLKTIQKNNATIIIGNREFSHNDLLFYFGQHHKINCNFRDSFNERVQIAEEFETIVRNCNSYVVIILATGCGGRAMCHRFIQLLNQYKLDAIIIDIGSSIDALMGKNTRAWIEYTPDRVPELKQILAKLS